MAGLCSLQWPMSLAAWPAVAVNAAQLSLASAAGWHPAPVWHGSILFDDAIQSSAVSRIIVPLFLILTILIR